MRCLAKDNRSGIMEICVSGIYQNQRVWSSKPKVVYSLRKRVEFARSGLAVIIDLSF